jgi:hypothetical protein
VTVRAGVADPRDDRAIFALLWDSCVPMLRISTILVYLAPKYLLRGSSSKPLTTKFFGC